MKFNMIKRVLGVKGECEAVRFLKHERYKIVEQNYKNKIGEIDIIALDLDNTIVFVEVKTRSSAKMGRPCESVTYVKQKKIRRCAEYYLISNNAYGNFNIRFDVIDIIDGEPINHIKNAF